VYDKLFKFTMPVANPTTLGLNRAF